MSTNKKILICDIITLVCEVLFIFLGILSTIVAYKLFAMRESIEENLALIISSALILTITLTAYIISSRKAKKLGFSDKDNGKQKE